VVTTGVSGIPELVSHGVNGLLVPSDDPAALAEHLGVLLGDAALRRRLGEAGRRKVEAEFALEANARRLYGLFQRVLDLPQAPAVTRGTAGNPPARRGRAAKPDKLPTLAQACDPERMRALLVEILHAEGVAGVEVEVLHRRKRRCVLRYRVRWGAEAPREASCIGKVYAGDRGLPVYELMQALARHGFARDAADGVSIPAAEAYVPELGLLVQEEVGGSPVGAYIGTAEEEYAVRRLGAAVAKLHRSPLRPGEPWGLAQHLGRCHPSPRTLVAAVPELRREVDALVAGAARHLGEHPVRHWALLHGDLHLAQVHVARQRTWLIDLDACCVGDPAADLGNVLVFLSAKCRRHGRRALREALLDAYCREMPEEILERVPAFEALTHLRRACKRLRLQERGWRRKARRAVHAGLGCLAHAAERRGGGVHG
jgi:aminoglycoside phosphotransferase (APT) family kinase protein